MIPTSKLSVLGPVFTTLVRMGVPGKLEYEIAARPNVYINLGLVSDKTPERIGTIQTAIRNKPVSMIRGTYLYIVCDEDRP